MKENEMTVDIKDIPNLEKMKEVKPFSQKIGEFLDFLENEEWEIVMLDENMQIINTHFETERIIAKFFDIDFDEAEKERQLILADLQ